MIRLPLLCRALAPVLMFMGAGAPLSAQDVPPPPAPHEIPAEAFVTGTRLAGAEIAPDGKVFAYEIQKDGRTVISVADFATRQVLMGIEAGITDDYRWFNFAGPRRIIFSRMINEKQQYRLSRREALYVADLDTGAVSEVALKRQGLDGNNVIFRDPGGEFVLLSVSAGLNGAPPSVWRVPLDGTAKENAVKVQDEDGDIGRWFADRDGVVRLGRGRSGRDSRIIEYRSGPGEEFRRIEKAAYLSDDDDKWDSLHIFAGSDTGNVLVADEDDNFELRQINLLTGELGDVVLAKPDANGLDSARYHEDELIAAGYADDEPRIHWFDDRLARQHAMLEQALPEGRVSFQSMSRDRSRMLVVHRGAADPGALYLFSPAEGRLDLAFNLRPGIDHRALSEPQTFEFTSRDGHTMSGLLTVPQGREAKNLPLIVHPHGGPYGVRDMRVYDDWVQLLATRGYAVLQVNFRGSSGRGKNFEELGFGTIGYEMQDDLDDAVDWATQQGIVDPERACIFGASYGGYAAMWGVLRNPERYRCAISLNGVADWDTQLLYDKWYFTKKFYEKMIEAEVGERNKRLSDVSISKNIGKLQRPMLVVSSEIDRRVPPEQADMISRASYRTDAPVEFLRLTDGHGLWFEDSRRKFTEAMLAFLAKHNPTDVLTPETAPRLTQVASAD